MSSPIAAAPDAPKSKGRNTIVLAVAVATIIGAVIASQGRFNGDLTSFGAGFVVATWLSYVVTWITIGLLLLLRGQGRWAWDTIRTKSKWWWFAIGMTGIPLVLAMAGGIPLVGVAIASVASVAGQTAGGLTLDARGVGREAPVPLTGRRILAGLIALAGLGLAVIGSGHIETSAWVVALIGLALFVGGALICIQSAYSGQITRETGNPALAAFCTGTGGLWGISLITAVVWAFGGLDTVVLPGFDQWWLYLGGPLGAAITVLTAWAVPRLGVFALTLSVVGGQLLISIMFDLERNGYVSWPTIVSALVVCAAVTLAMPKQDPDAT